MLNPLICSKCKHSKRESMPQYDLKSGNKISIWSIDCCIDKKNPILFMIASDEAPDNCPYILEHEIVMGNLNSEDKYFVSNIE